MNPNSINVTQGSEACKACGATQHKILSTSDSGTHIKCEACGNKWFERPINIGQQINNLGKVENQVNIDKIPPGTILNL